MLAVAVMLVYATVFRSHASSHAAAARHAIERASPVLAIVLSLSMFVVGMRHGSFVVRIYDPLDSDGASRDPIVIPVLTPCPCTERDGTRLR